MPKKHQGPYLPSHGEFVTDKTRKGEVVRLHGVVPDVVDVRWDGASEPERNVPSSTLSHDYTSPYN